MKDKLSSFLVGMFHNSLPANRILEAVGLANGKKGQAENIPLNSPVWLSWIRFSVEQISGGRGDSVRNWQPEGWGGVGWVKGWLACNTKQACLSCPGSGLSLVSVANHNVSAVSTKFSALIEKYGLIMEKRI